MRRVGKLFDSIRVLKGCFNAYDCPAWSIVPLCGCRLRSLIWVPKAYQKQNLIFSQVQNLIGG